jgi:hypothetical protein
MPGIVPVTGYPTYTGGVSVHLPAHRPSALLGASLALLALALCSRAIAHHSVTSVYDTSKTISLVGDVRQLQLDSPHSLLVIEVGDPHGQSVAWRGELPALVFLHRAGWTTHSLAVGEHVHVTGSPSRYSATDFYVVSITKSDGTQLPLLPSSAPPTPTDKPAPPAP